MDPWLSEMAMVLNNEDMVPNNYLYSYNLLSEEIQLILGDDNVSFLRSSPFNDNNNNNNSDDNLLPNPTILSTCNIDESNISTSPRQEQQPYDDQNEKDCKQDDDAKAEPKRRRDGIQIQDHINSERKRRELHAKQFMALATIVPDLTKVDKCSVLQQSIKYIQELQQKVKKLEEVLANKQNVESMVVENDEDDDFVRTVDINVSLPRIEAKISKNTLVLMIYCENRKEIVSKILAMVEKYEMNIRNTSIAHFGPSAFDITIVAQTKKMENKHVKNLVKHLHLLLRRP
ncbi:hypothetical protein RND81_05G206200 [Saponaria officinalis]|uniref:Uncharacterized protein n=1 Tax=Saponaria officinalis TaxID=3572 RepID=A0AAW1L0K7_SAPOF